ncbi:MAG: hypothetical protein EON47_08125 [Acetobacteraceae bacterium]|nr:MAG: hypothetical protein EON47_08125 [Acetobacteraceae bacterium]
MLASLLVTRSLPPAAPLPSEQFGWMVLPRHGLRPLRFKGRALVRAAARDPALPVWSEVVVHETEGGLLVVAIRHECRGEAAPPCVYAEAFGHTDAAIEFLHAHDPLRDLPVAVLYAGAEAAPDGLRDAAALACADRLRRGWQEVLTACFGARHHIRP